MLNHGLDNSIVGNKERSLTRMLLMGLGRVRIRYGSQAGDRSQVKCWSNNSGRSYEGDTEGECGDRSGSDQSRFQASSGRLQ